MNYVELTDDNGKKHIMIDNGDGSFKSFPADKLNPEYVSFLAKKKKHLTENYTQDVE
jgi:hypothetical protein